MSEIPPTRSIYQRDAWLIIIVCLLLQIFGGLLIYPAVNSAFPSASKTVIDFVSTIFILLLPVIYLSLRYGMINFSDFLLKGLDYVVLVIAFIVLVIWTSIISFQGPYKSYMFDGQELSQLPRFESFVVLLIMFLIGPFLEETLFRRYIFEIFRSKYKIPIALFLTAFTETLLHIWNGNISELISTFFSMIFFTLIYFKSRLGASIIIHCLTNIFLYHI